MFLNMLSLLEETPPKSLVSPRINLYHKYKNQTNTDSGLSKEDPKAPKGFVSNTNKQVRAQCSGSVPCGKVTTGRTQADQLLEALKWSEINHSFTSSAFLHHL